MTVVYVDDWYIYVWMIAGSAFGALACIFGVFFFKAGQFGRAYARLRMRSNVGTLECGMDRIRMRPLNSDGITATDEKARKMYGMKQDARYITSDGAVLFLNYAPVCSVVSARVLATIPKLKEADSKALREHLDNYWEKQFSGEHGGIPLQNPDGTPLLDSMNKPVIRPTVFAQESALPKLSDKPVDGKLSPRELFDEIINTAHGFGGFLLSVKDVFSWITEASPLDLRAAWNGGYAQAKDEDRKRFQGTQIGDVMKWVILLIGLAIAAFIIMKALGLS